jgi:hypothetical protein
MQQDVRYRSRIGGDLPYRDDPVVRLQSNCLLVYFFVVVATFLCQTQNEIFY